MSLPLVADASNMPSPVGDVRGHWVDTSLLGENRVVFDTGPTPEKARLKISNVSETDDGIYRCRVDFSASQTRTSRLNLTVIGKMFKKLYLDSFKPTSRFCPLRPKKCLSTNFIGRRFSHTKDKIG